MDYLKYVLDPAILIIILVFVGICGYTILKYRYVRSNLLNIDAFLANFKKEELSYRYKELDAKMSSNNYINVAWREFANTLFFPDKIKLKDNNNDYVFENLSSALSNIQTTVDPSYFFNDESLMTSKYNVKFVQIAPTLLTGLGPLFTFLNIAISFSKLDFSTQETVMFSINELMSGMQVAALCSVLAVSFSLIFLILERVLNNVMCKSVITSVQGRFYTLFDSISAEKFLIEILKESKIQNYSLPNVIDALPDKLKTVMDQSLTDKLIPYLENMIYGIKKLNETVTTKSKPSTDIIDDLF